MQLAFDAADRLVELVEERRGPVPAEEAARSLFALAHAPVALAPVPMREGHDAPRAPPPLGGGVVIPESARGLQRHQEEERARDARLESLLGESGSVETANPR